MTRNTMQKDTRFLGIFLKELPIVACLIYLAYIAVLFHDRSILAPDYAFTFDSWWYMHSRLQDGQLAQWNPFVLLGKNAVQWNHLPLSIFTPFILLGELTLEAFHFYHIVGTFLSLFLIYLFGRLMGYGRYLPFLPVLILSLGCYRFEIAHIFYATFLSVFPLSLFAYFKYLHSGKLNYLLIFILLFAVSLIGCRLEVMVYCITFVSIMLFVSLSSKFSEISWKKGVAKSIFYSAGIMLFVLVLSAWQFPLLIASTEQSARVNLEWNLAGLFNAKFIKWFFISLVYQGALVMVLLNLIFIGLISGKKKIQEVQVDWKIFRITLLLQFTILAFIKFSPEIYGLTNDIAVIFDKFAINLLMRNWWWFHAANPFHTLLIILSVGFASTIYFLQDRKLQFNAFLKLFAVIFTGLYVSDFSALKWPVDMTLHYFFMPTILTSMVILGAVQLYKKKKTWILLLLAVFHLINESGALVMNEFFNIPWNTPRAIFPEFPFQIILILESIVFFIQGVSLIFLKCGISLFEREENKQYITVFFNILIVVLFFGCIKDILVPFDKEKQTYLFEYPFASTRLDSSRPVNDHFYGAMRETEKFKQSHSEKNSQKRAILPDSLNKPLVNYIFFPSYSQTLNTGPVFSSEIPEPMISIFHGNPIVDVGANKQYHPETNPLVYAYLCDKYNLDKRLISTTYDYIDKVSIFPDKFTPKFTHEILAEEGGSQNRVFITDKVIKFTDHREEHLFLENHLGANGKLKDQITTSDQNFGDIDYEMKGTVELQTNVEILEDLPEMIKIQATLNKDGYLALLDTWSKGWKATIDREEVPIYRGYVGTRFIKVPEGTHNVEFSYTTPRLAVSVSVSIIAWLILIVLLIRNTKWQKNNPKDIDA